MRVKRVSEGRVSGVGEVIVVFVIMDCGEVDIMI